MHGSAPDIAGENAANPLATILAAGMALRHSLDLPEAAAAVDQAVDDVLAAGLRTADIAGTGPTATTGDMGNAVARAIAM